MSFISLFILFTLTLCVLIYQRRSLWLSTTCILLIWFTLGASQLLNHIAYIIGWIVLIPLALIFNTPLRRICLTRYIFKQFRKKVPKLSQTEQVALAAGDKSWEAELFNGKPDWSIINKFKLHELSAEEEQFLTGPTQTLCNMTKDWEINYCQFDLNKDIWEFIKQEGFFSLIIPKKYGGKEFSAHAHSQIIAKLAGTSITIATTVAVPNSLGPAELLLHYGTDEQKKYYLPRLANGTDIPCFALTSPEAGSDAASIPDEGIICYEQYEGKKTLGIKLNFDKRYITLAPVSTLIGLAFQALDPNNIIGQQKEYGITCALLNHKLPGMEIGNRHLPLNLAFQNGPVRGKNVFIPMDSVIGGQAMLGHGWKMLMSCLAAGRAISLPATTCGGAELCTLATASYVRIRKQFNLPLAEFEGIKNPLARMAANVYQMKAARTVTNSLIDSGLKPALLSAIMKYHVTEIAQTVGKDAMDCQAGKGICMGPKNYLASGYMASAIAITVEGANILTRNMIIYGQGAMRSHPYIHKEIESCSITDPKQALKLFDQHIWGHLGFIISNILRTLCLSCSFGLLGRAKEKGILKKHQRYFHLLTRFSAAFALISDMAMICLGSALKKKESLSARLGDILSYLYLSTCTLKYFLAQPEAKYNEPLLIYVLTSNFYKIQTTFIEITENFPNKWLGRLLKWIIFPRGQQFKTPRDIIAHTISEQLTKHSKMRDYFAHDITAADPSSLHPVRELLTAFDAMITIIPLEKKLKQAVKDGKITAKHLEQQIIEAEQLKLMTEEEIELLTAALKLQKSIIAVDEFTDASLQNIISSSKQRINQHIVNN